MEGPQSALLARCCAFRRRSPNLTESGRLRRAAGTALHAPKRSSMAEGRQGNGCIPAQRWRSARIDALPQNLMYPLSCKPIAPVPKLANRTPLALVIDSLLVRTANYAVGDRDGSHPMLFDKFKDLAGNARIVTDVTTIHYPDA